MSCIVRFGAPCVLAWLALVPLARGAHADPAGPDTSGAGVPVARAGTLDTVAPGTLMRIATRDDPRSIVWTRQPMFRGTLLRATADSLWVSPVGDDRVLDFAREGVAVEIRAGRSHFNGAWTGAALGLLTGFAAGTIGAIVYSTGSDDDMASLSYLVFPILVSCYTVPIGAVIGGISGVDRWARVN